MDKSILSEIPVLPTQLISNLNTYKNENANDYNNYKATIYYCVIETIYSTMTKISFGLFPPINPRPPQRVSIITL